MFPATKMGGFPAMHCTRYDASGLLPERYCRTRWRDTPPKLFDPSGRDLQRRESCSSSALASHETVQVFAITALS